MNRWRGRRLSQGKHLPSKPGDLSQEDRKPWDKSNVVMHICNPSIPAAGWQMERADSLNYGPASLVYAKWQ